MFCLVATRYVYRFSKAGNICIRRLWSYWSFEGLLFIVSPIVRTISSFACFQLWLNLVEISFQEVHGCVLVEDRDGQPVPTVWNQFRRRFWPALFVYGQEETQKRCEIRHLIYPGTCCRGNVYPFGVVSDLWRPGSSDHLFIGGRRALCSGSSFWAWELQLLGWSLRPSYWIQGEIFVPGTDQPECPCGVFCLDFPSSWELIIRRSSCPDDCIGRSKTFTESSGRLCWASLCSYKSGFPNGFCLRAHCSEVCSLPVVV